MPAGVESLFQPLRVGALALRNRIVMAPMTRNRAERDGTPREMMALHYGQRATAGLILTEATYVAPEGKGYPNVPGIVSDRHAQGWRPVVDAVHARGGLIALQLWHAGRVSHSSLIGNGLLPVAPSALAVPGRTFTPQGLVPFEVPRPLAVDEMEGIARTHALAARRALQAGFDAVEVHAGNGYLLDQFLRDGSNRRTDAYGGPVDNRIRLVLQVVDAVIAECGGGRVGLRLSPFNPANGMADAAPRALFGHLAAELARRDLAWLHVTRMGIERAGDLAFDLAELRAAFGGTFIANGGYGRDEAAAALASGAADLVAFGIPYTANPDLVERFRHGLALTRPDPNAFYTGGEAGYTDFRAVAA